MSKIINVDISCEGYSYPEDPYILAGSCGIKYELNHIEQQDKTSDSHDHDPDQLHDVKMAMLTLMMIMMFGTVVFVIMSYDCSDCNAKKQNNVDKRDKQNKNVDKQDKQNNDKLDTHKNILHSSHCPLSHYSNCRCPYHDPYHINKHHSLQCLFNISHHRNTQFIKTRTTQRRKSS